MVRTSGDSPQMMMSST
ncbi:hypothetical protein AYX14_07189 [Cryptococcus neoformans]|nr:hypothetical protein AYX14_07189 [Cryptococcus neoformans var. grubii]